MGCGRGRRWSGEVVEEKGVGVVAQTTPTTPYPRPNQGPHGHPTVPEHLPERLLGQKRTCPGSHGWPHAPACNTSARFGPCRVAGQGGALPRVAATSIGMHYHSEGPQCRESRTCRCVGRLAAQGLASWPHTPACNTSARFGPYCVAGQGGALPRVAAISTSPQQLREGVLMQSKTLDHVHGSLDSPGPQILAPCASL